MEPPRINPTVRTRRPRIRPLSTRQSIVVLERNRVGRIAYVDGARPGLIPVHYVLHEGVIVGRTSIGLKSLAWIEAPHVVFEVDEVDGTFDWQSVIVQGTIAVLRDFGSHHERKRYWTAVNAFRAFIPEAMTERDPTPDRHIVFTIDPIEIAGRAASTRDGS